MNFLAHLYLADDHPAALIGNLMPDLVRGRLPAALDPEVARGVALHRRVDALTDTHPVFARSRDRLRPAHGRFAGILVDVFYDHVLARHWAQYHALPLSAFAQQCYARMLSGRTLMPDAMRRTVEVMAQQDWLSGYASLAGLELTLARMSARLTRRFARPICLESALEGWPRIGPMMESDFHPFFRDLRATLCAQDDWQAPTDAAASGPLPRAYGRLMPAESGPGPTLHRPGG